MYALAVLLTVLLVGLTSSATLWAGWQFAQMSSTESDSLVWGLDSYGLYVVVGMAATVLLKYAAPVLAVENWPTQRFCAVFFAVTWVGCVAVQSVFVIYLVSVQIIVPTDLTDPRLLPLISWPVLDIIASLLPVALISPEARPRRRTTDTSDTSSAPAPVVIGALERRSTSNSQGIKDGLLRFLQDVAQRPPGLVLAGVYITLERTIRTSQGTLARLLHVSKSTINRSLQSLSAEGHIRFETTARETMIAVMN